MSEVNKITYKQFNKSLNSCVYSENITTYN